MSTVHFTPLVHIDRNVTQSQMLRNHPDSGLSYTRMFSFIITIGPSTLLRNTLPLTNYYTTESVDEDGALADL